METHGIQWKSVPPAIGGPVSDDMDITVRTSPRREPIRSGGET